MCERNMENNALTGPQTRVMHLPNIDGWVEKNMFSEFLLSALREIYRSITDGLAYVEWKHSFQARDREDSVYPLQASKQKRKISTVRSPCSTHRGLVVSVCLF